MLRARLDRLDAAAEDLARSRALVAAALGRVDAAEVWAAQPSPPLPQTVSVPTPGSQPRSADLVSTGQTASTSSRSTPKKRRAVSFQVGRRPPR
jgi:hypothetical protein